MRALFAMCLALATPTIARADTFWVSTSGSPDGDGTSERPFDTIGTALRTIDAAGGHTVIVRDGVYEGQTVVARAFESPVIVRSEHPYAATLTNAAGGGEALRIYFEGPVRIVFEGFVFTNHHASNVCVGREAYFLIHVQDAEDVTLRDNVIHGNDAPGTCNELLKINRGSDTAFPRNIRIEGNLFYDSANAGGADMIDAVRAGELDIVDNVFVGTPEHTESQSFITIKRQAAAPADVRSPRFVVARNVFVHWGGKTDQAFVQFGEDGVAEEEISDALIENNLFIGDSAASMAAPIQLKGAGNILVRANTIVGDLPSGAFLVRVGTEGDNPAVRGFRFVGNVLADPTGTMSARLVNRYGLAEASSIVLDGNLYWNAGGALPAGGDATAADDVRAVLGDPALPSGAIALPSFEAGRFASGSTTIREEFLRLVAAASLGETSAAIDVGDPSAMPSVDIRGLDRGTAPDLGAFERGATVGVDMDAGPRPDAGADGAVSDASRPDAGRGDTPRDARVDGTAADAGTVDDDGGCDCSTGAASSSRLWLVILVVLGARVGRRRRRSDHSAGRCVASGSAKLIGPPREAR